MNKELRKMVKLLKVNSGISYKEIAHYMEMPEASLYCWLTE